MPDTARPLGFEFTDDPATLRTLIEMHAPKRGPLLGLSILDCTFGEGRMWRGLDYSVRSLDFNAVDVTFYFEPFLREAARVLTRDGVLLAKIGDQVHRNRRRFQPFKFWAAVEASGRLHNCDVRMQGRSGNGFKYAGREMHLLTNYVCWFVVRRGSRCTRDA